MTCLSVLLAIPQDNVKRASGGIQQVVGGITADVLKERVPLLFVDVNLGSNRTERITVYEGDRSDELAAQFAATHSKLARN